MQHSGSPSKNNVNIQATKQELGLTEDIFGTVTIKYWQEM